MATECAAMPWSLCFGGAKGTLALVNNDAKTMCPMDEK